MEHSAGSGGKASARGVGSAIDLGTSADLPDQKASPTLGINGAPIGKPATEPPEDLSGDEFSKPGGPGTNAPWKDGSIAPPDR
jgi:hypothetical protein